jgi:DNA polymerase-3 subunit gamma/tau
VIDEVYMLSNAAFNALLKTLEEPLDRVVFILATTDPQRVLPTIISRCQRFDFRRIPQSRRSPPITQNSTQPADGPRSGPFSGAYIKTEKKA